ncbi:oxidoreductase [Pontibacillus chungwhensis BH030062]|uniref:Oxidoreductase n=1 Tax=Pontibacillus chungwhensis BH030062 TaxID=1385513 RepID=A0A0A2V2G3_9BACI|nr:Gfo/Idh/MocA family oxidoreductase [Pontibacillus chungwhensis]KGP93001.1 oxidoreductase [Pontibacillus chungwhensis BH030062]
MSLSICVIGAGIIAQHHLKAIKEITSTQLLAVADTDSDKAMNVAAKNEVKGYTSYKEMIVKETPDLVIITLPHFLHKEAALFSAKEGCHILLEKPMALTSAECHEILRCVKDNGVKLMVAHTQHYLAENITAKEYIETHDLGPLLMVNDSRFVPYFNPDRPKWFLEKRKAGGGIFMNLGTHSIDKIQWLTNSAFTFVKANLYYPTAILQTDVEGSGTVYLETSTGVPVTISMSGFSVVPTQRTEFIFEEGIVKVEIGKGVFITKEGKYTALKVQELPDPFVLQLKDMIRTIHGDQDSNGNYAKLLVRTIERIYESNDQNKGLTMNNDHL